MALIPCRECGKEISDQAVACPHCGAPLSVQPVAQKHEQITNLAAVLTLVGILVVVSVGGAVFFATGSVGAVVVVMILGIIGVFWMTTLRK